ncbi:MAG TPA: FtsX-like permease family protein [Gaiellaceae bacterium]|jgi:putative ABC transport system permease protein
MVPVARRNLFAEKGRFAMSVGGVAFAVLLILIVVSLYRGWSAAGSVYRELPGDVWLAQAGTSDPYHSTSLLPAGHAAALARVPGVAAALPVYARHLAFPTRGGERVDAYLMSIGLPRGLDLPAETKRFFPAAGHVLIERGLADQAGVKAGGELVVLGRRLVVDPVTGGGNKIVQFAFVNPVDGRALLGQPGRVSYYALVLEEGANPTAVARAAVSVVPGSETHTSADFAGAFQRLVTSGFLSVVGVLVGIGFVVGGAVIALTTYTATVEKARDFGVLKAVGAPGSFLYRIVVWQSLIVGLAGSVLGILVAALTAGLIGRWVPEFVTDLRALDTLGVFAAAVVMSVVASFVPVRRLNRIDPAMVFRA